MQTVLITGANGFVGHYLTERLLRSGYKVIATGKGPERLQHSHAHYQYQSLDITNAEEVSAVFQKYSPQLVVHGAAMTKPDECELDKEAAWKVNVGGTENLLAAAAANGQPFFLHISTDFIFQGTAPVYTEADPGDPVNYYGKTKLEAEERVEGYPGAWTIVRPILIYGQPLAGRSNILTFVADALRAGKPVRLFTDQHRRPTYVEDLVWGMERIMAKRATGIYHFSGKDTLSPFDIGMRVAAYLGLDAGLVQPVTEAEFYQPAKRPPQTLFDLTKVKQELGYEPSSFEEGLRRTFGK